MNQTGGCGSGSRRQARRRAESAAAAVDITADRLTRPGSLPAPARCASPELSDPRGTVVDREVVDMTHEMRWCFECRDVRPFEAPPCEDGHDDCADRSCVECGFALTVGVVLTEDVVLVVAA